ncbi:MAG: PEP-CTERM sorting domain-containing protein [Phycisphaerales bacterium]
MRKKRNYLFRASATFVLVISAIANSAILQVSDIQITCPGAFYSYASGTGGLNINRTVIGLLELHGAATYDYSISNGNVTITSALVQDTSSGGLARGTFAGGRTMTLTGTITHTATATTIYTGTIFSALMTIDSTGTWILAESPSLAINGSVEFNPNTTVGLGAGIAYGGNVLKLGAFRSDFSFKGLQPNPTKFNVTQTLMGTASTIQITAIPEPASLLMFVTALGALRIKKK